LNITTPDELSLGLGFALDSGGSAMIGKRLVQEIESRGLIRDVSNWQRGVEADYFLRVKLGNQQAVWLGRSGRVSDIWKAGHQNHDLQRDEKQKPSPLRLSWNIEATVYTNTNLPIASKEFVLATLHSDATCGDYVWLGMLLREDPEGRDFSSIERKLKKIRQIDGDRALSRARQCFSESYDLIVKDTMTEVADFSLSAIESVQPPPSSPEESVDVASQKVPIVIASIPSGADVMVDELFVGQTPLRLSVSSRVAHSIQLSAAGFEEMVKLIDPSTLNDGSVHHLLYRLKAIDE